MTALALIVAEAHYTYRMGAGPVRLVHDTEAAQVVIGKTLLDMEAEDFSDPRSRQEARRFDADLDGLLPGG